MRIEVSVINACGRASDVAVDAAGDTPWTQLAPALAACTGVDGGFVGWRRLEPARTLAGSGLRRGDVLAARPLQACDAAHRAFRQLRVVGGPAAGRVSALQPGRVLVGRDPDCDVVVDDPSVSRRHCELEVTVSGTRVRDLGSAHGTRHEGRPVGSAWVPVLPGEVLRIGASLLAVHAGRDEPAATSPTGDGRILINRATHNLQPLDERVVDLPAAALPARPARMHLTAAVLPLAASAAIAVLLHSPVLLLFGLLSPLGYLAGEFGERLHGRRGRRRSDAVLRARVASADDALRRALARERALRRVCDPDAAALLQAATGHGRRVWERPAADPGLLRVRLGSADLPSALSVRRPRPWPGDDPGSADGPSVEPAGTVEAVPVTADLALGPLGLVGPAAVTRAVARHVVGRLATLCSPAQLRLSLLLDPCASSHWSWARWLPHLDAVGAPDPSALRQLSGSAQQWQVLVLDCQDGDTVLPARLAEALDDGAARRVSAICLARREAELPAGCVTIVRCDDAAGATLQITDAQAAVPARVQVLGEFVDEKWAESLARGLAPLVDAASADDSLMPVTCRLVDLLGDVPPTAETVLARWQETEESLRTVVGRDTDGPVWLDLCRDGPHTLIAGTTGSGKSQLLRALVAGLAANHPPSAVCFVLVDYKGGAAFAECAGLPHTVGLVTDLDPHLTRRVLRSIDSEVRRREALFAAAGVGDIGAYRRCRDRPPMPRLVLVVDEFAELAEQLPDFVTGLVGIARRGRSLGLHLVLATQRAGAAVSSDIRANAALRIALRMLDEGESRSVVDCPDAAALDPALPGRAVLRRGGRTTVLQTARVDTSGADDAAKPPAVHLLEDWLRPPAHMADRSSPPSNEVTDLQRLVAAVSEAARRDAGPPVHRPWLPPLPAELPIESLHADPDGCVAIGLLDCPAEQAQPALVLDLHGGSLLVAGGPRSGRSTALVTLAGAAASALPPSALHVYAIDGGSALGPLRLLPHCATLTPVGEFAVVSRLLQRLVATVTGRDPGTSDARSLLLLDGWELFRSAAEAHDGGSGIEAVMTLLRLGPAAGLTVAISGDGPTLAGQVGAAAGLRLGMALGDPALYALLGVSGRDQPGHLPAGRAIRSGDGALVQLAHLGDRPTPAATESALRRIARHWTASPLPVAPIRLRPLPASASLHALRAAADGPREGQVCLGVGGDDARAISANLSAGRRRFLVAGPSGSGRSSTLASVLVQLLDAGIGAVVAAPERSPLAALARARGCPLVRPADAAPGARLPPGGALVVDDADTFQDCPAGDLLVRWAERADTATVVVATRADELALSFRGIAAEVRRCGCGVLLAPAPGDGALLGVTVPGRALHPPPGRGLLVPDPAWGLGLGSPVPIQVASL